MPSLRQLVDGRTVWAVGTSEGATKGWDTRGRGRREDDLYHVTHTKLVPKIQKQGLRPMQTSNWVQSGNRSRYGSGEIYTFENPKDAQRWAGKMDWQFNKEIGSGKVSILRVARGNENWQEDAGDPLSHAGAKGKWLKYMGAVPADRIIESEPFTHEHARRLVQGN